MKTTYEYLSNKVAELKKELIQQIESDIDVLLNDNPGMNQVRIRNTCQLSSLGDSFYADLRGIKKEDNDYILNVERHIENSIDEFEDGLEEQDLESLIEIILQLNGESELSFSK